ncbi:carboxynorspermidine decarboxylase [Porphyromonas sp.]|uniref:carboxynorspermidine decarboxylase n=1 Tax=Porphyromonas sp. TaxID=1924944 RepID=UPI0026DD831E|nr:carboxynorspermidine decarboxylase [Porphyromonas sp.]MDO4770305.1 carboxynorspermidine decarboxylase [Porphyromonas sp.]
MIDKSSLDEIFPSQIQTPCYVLEEELLRRNLSLIKRVAKEADVEIILAFKAYALHKSFPIFREYIECSTASSINEARLAYEEMGSPAHTYAPVYKDSEFDTIMACSSHITFNTPAQFERFYPKVKAFADGSISCGIRINPEYSEVGTDLYNPCAPGSRLGTIADELPYPLPKGVEGLHFHTHCESNSYDLEKTLEVVEEKFARYLPHIKWLNMGGGHLMTHKDYDVEHLIGLLRAFKAKYPNLHIIMEPGSAFAWQTGYLVTQVLDIVENKGIKTLIMDASFTCHMPDCLEMPYQPAVRGAEKQPTPGYGYRYRIGGNSCLSGDVIGDWYFDHEPKVGELLIFEDMIHYTTVKTTMFNGIVHPAIYMHRTDGRWEEYRTFTYDDYKSRMC